MAKPDPLARNLIRACMELHRRRSWERTMVDAPILIHVPTEEEPVVGVLTGQGEGDQGLVLSSGPDALDRLHEHVLRRHPDDAHLDQLDLLSVSFEPLSEIPVELRKTLTLAGVQARREHVVPELFSAPAHRDERSLNRREMKTLLWCLGAIFAVEDRGELCPRALYPGSRVLELEVSGAMRAPRVEVRFVSWSTSEVGDEAAALSLPEDLAELPRTDRCWLATSPALLGRLEGDDRAWDAFVLYDESWKQWICSPLVPRGDLESLVPPLVEALRERGLPREILFAEGPLSDALAPGLAALGVKVGVDPFDPRLLELRDSVVASKESAAGPSWARLVPETPGEWEEVHRDFARRLCILAHEEQLVRPRALNRYFGDAEEAKLVMEELEDLGPFPTFLEWLVADYRATKRSKTFLEKQLLRRNLHPVDRMLTQARSEAILSFFRIVSVRPGESFEVEDILDGELHTVHDRDLSASEFEGHVLPLRLFRVQGWTFPLIAGPPLPLMELDRILHELEGDGLRLDREGMREGAHVLGELWSLLLDARDAPPPRLQNTDGDPLELQRARFHVADAAIFTEALEARPDVEAEEPGASWSWFREGGPAPGFGERTSLGRLELFDDSLLLEVNSVARLERARSWLEELPGVRFETASRVDLDALPLDDRLPGPAPEQFSEEAHDQLREFLLERNRQWLDESIPALGGRTPREACRTEEGRRKVAMMIRTMPPMRVPGGEIEPPRVELMRELGIEDR